MALVQARLDLLKQKLGEFSDDERLVLKAICLHHTKTRGELVDEVPPEDYNESLKVVDSAVNRAVRMGLIVNVGGQYTFRPSDDWHEYLDELLLSAPIVSKKKGQVN